MRTIFFISELDIISGNSAGGVRICNMMKSIAAAENVRVEYLRFCGHPRKFFTNISNRISQAGESAIFFYPQSNPLFEILFIFWAKRHYSGHIFCDINEVRRFECSYLKRFNPVKRVIAKVVYAQTEKLSSFYYGLICISGLIQEYFSKFNNNAIIVPVLSDIPDHMPKMKKTGDVFKFAFVGSVCIEKENLAELMKGFSKLKNKADNWVFNVYGAPPFNDYNEINACVESLCLTDRVVFHGPVSHKEVPVILAESDCLLLPRRNTLQNHYGFSTKLSEYSVSGTPIILTDTGVVKDYFKDGENCLLVNGYEADGFCEQMEKVLRMSDSERYKIASGAFALACARFDYRLYSESLSAFIK